jgi:hypothetical protein
MLQKHRTKLAAIAILGVAVVITDRLTHLPTAESILQGRTWEIPVGHEVVLGGIKPGPLVTIESAAGDGVKLEAGPLRLDDGRTVNRLSWQVSKLDGQPAGDNKVKVPIDASGPGEPGSVIMQRAGEEVRPELLIGSADTALRVEAGLAIGDSLELPPMALIADGRPLDLPGFGIGFTLLPGGDVSLAFPSHPDGTPKGLTLAPGQRERTGLRLRLREIGIGSEGARRPWKSACAAPAGDHLWSALVRRSTTPAGSDCSAEPLLAVTALGISKDRISVDLAGSAYVTDASAPVTARWWSWATANPLLGMVFLLLMGGIGRWFWKTVTGNEKFPGA